MQTHEAHATYDPYATLLRCHYVKPASIALPACLVFFRAHWLLLALADGRNAIGRDTEADDVVFDRGCPPLAERKVVFRSAARVSMPFHRDAHGRPSLQVVGISRRNRAPIVTQH